MEKIKSISEAFSMQPAFLSVCKHDHKHSKTCIREIEAKTIRVDSDKQCTFYVGYNFSSEKIFEYLQSSVNVHYENI